jgi:hypothetical protein
MLKLILFKIEKCFQSKILYSGTNILTHGVFCTKETSSNFPLCLEKKFF